MNVKYPSSHKYPTTLSESWDSDLKLSIIEEWEKEMSTDAIKFRACAACAINITLSDSLNVNCSEIDLRLLRNDEVTSKVRPTGYDFDLYQRAILYPKGLEHTDRIGNLRLCKRCHRALDMSRTPKFSLANWLYYGRDGLPTDVKDAFEASSMFERMLIARARCTVSVADLQLRKTRNLIAETEVFNSLTNARKGIRGNIMVSPLDTFKMNRVIPPGPSSIRDTMCALFVASTLPSPQTIQKLSPVLVRRSRVKTMIEFLLCRNDFYQSSPSFDFSEENLLSLLDPNIEIGIPPSVEIESIKGNDAIEILTSDYTDRNDIPDNSADELLMDNVGYTDGDDTPANYAAMKSDALKHCLAGKRFLASGKGSDAVPDFNNPAILTWLFPHLDPWGIGGFFHPKRKISISMEEQLRYLLMRHDRVFQADPEFAFVFYNITRKAQVSKTVRFTVPKHRHKSVIDKLLATDPITLATIEKKSRENPSYTPENDEERSVLRLLTSIGMVARHIPGSDGYKILRRNEIRALIVKLGAPSLFITINPSDVDNPIVRLYSGEEIDLEDITRGEDMNEWKRKLLAARNPAACALFFDLVVQKFIRIVLGYGKETPGAYGKCSGYYGTVEAQGKGTLHLHILVWLQGQLSPQALRDKLSECHVYQQKYTQWLESIVKCEFPLQNQVVSSETEYAHRVRAKDNGIPHPGVIASPSPRYFKDNIDVFWSQFYSYVDSLLNEYNWHEHHATCWKHLRPGEEKNDANCRMRMSGETRKDTELDVETCALMLRRLHPWIASYTDLATYLLKCNFNCKYIGSGEAAKAYLYYITDYITKRSIPTHVGAALLLHSIQRVSKILASDNSDQSKDTSAMINVVNSMMGRQEISHQQVMSYLIGGGDYYTSHKFFIIHWSTIYGFVNSFSENKAVQDSTGLTHPSTLNVTLQMTNQVVEASSQLLDYVHRSRESLFNSFCLYDFFAETEKVRLKSLDDIYGRFSSEEHPQQSTHRLQLRTHRVVPVLLGPGAPNPKTSLETMEVWAKFVLILFKPWRSFTDLRSDHTSWLSELEEYKTNWDKKTQMVIKNLTVLSECRDARDSQGSIEKTRTGVSHDSMYEDDLDAGDEDIEEEGIDVDDSESLEMNHVIDQATAAGTAQCLDVCYPTINCSEPANPTHVATVLPEEEETISSQLAQMKLKRKRAFQDIGEESSISQKRTQVQSKDPIAEISTLSETGRYIANCSNEEYNAVQSVITDYNLKGNLEQLRAFCIIANKLVFGGHQLLMHVSGVGGTGKSHVIQSIVTLLERLNRKEELVLAAPTGIAAVLIGGQTLHSLIMKHPDQKKRINVEGLISIWRHKKLVLLDEVSMVDARMLNEFSKRIRIGKGQDPVNSALPFGGVDVIFTGDFGQLKPPIEKSLYSHSITDRPSFAEVQNSDATGDINGVSLWRQVNTVVELKRNQRHQTDPIYASFLSRLRVGSCKADKIRGTLDDFEYLQPRLLENITKDSNNIRTFDEAPIIVGSKMLRDILNRKLLRRHAERTGKKIHTYYSRDIVNRSPAKGALKQILWKINSSLNRDSFGELPLFPGMKVMITENIAFDCGVVNGREGTVRKIKYEEISPGRRAIVVVYVHIPDCGVQFPGLDLDIVPIFPTSKSIKRTKRDGLHRLNAKSFTRRQVPLVPAYSYTDFKSQGRTLSAAIVDIVTARGQGVYVMLSRVKSLKGLAILRSFPASKIYQKISQELRVELERISTLDLYTQERVANDRTFQQFGSVL